MLSQQRQAKHCSISEQDAEAGQQSHEPAIVASADARVHPDTVVIEACHAALADWAVFTTSRLFPLARPTHTSWLVERVIKRICAHVMPVILCSDLGAVRRRREIREEIWQANEQWKQAMMQGRQPVPGPAHEEQDGAGEQDHEEDLQLMSGRRPVEV